MATATKTNNKEKMVEVFALWKKKSQKGNVYFTGRDAEKKNIRGFFNTTKKNPKEPDLKVYYIADGSVEKDPFVSMWVNTSAAGKKYLTGKIDDKRVVGFISETENEKYPYLRVFFATEKAAGEEKVEKHDPITCDDEIDDFPF